ncbi:MAG TPA: c-type cytochrome [Telluria sp.]
MRTPTILLLALGLVLGAAGRASGAQPIQAQPGAQPTQAPLLTPPPPRRGAARIMGLPGASAAQTGGPPSIEAGQQLAASGAGAIAACASCHGAQGEGMAATGFPRLARQPAYYLGKQLAAYATGARVNPVMQPIAKALSAQQIRDVSAYYATLGAGAASAGMPPASAGGAPRGSDRARTLDMVGDGARGVQACVNCHGPAGSGEPPIYPYLAGQHAAYLTAAMEQWKSGARSTDMSGQMPHIGRQLSAADITALAAYYSALPPPPPAVARINVPAGSSLRPAVAAAAGAPGPKAPGAAGVSGAGTEQGAPLTGGTGGGGAQGTQPPPVPSRPTPPPPDKR